MQIVAPTLLSPPNDAVLHGYPRTLTLPWSPVEVVAMYGVEVDCYGCCAAHHWCSEVGKKLTSVNTLTKPSYTFDFVGDQPGRWRTWGIAADSTSGPASEWRQFTFGRVVGGNIVPPVLPTLSPSEVQPCRPEEVRNTLQPDMTKPRALYMPDPEYSDAARKDKISGTVILGVDIGEDGLIKQVCVVRSLRPDLDANAVGAVKTWKFDPARKAGVAVPVFLNIEATFRL